MRGDRKGAPPDFAIAWATSSMTSARRPMIVTSQPVALSDLAFSRPQQFVSLGGASMVPYTGRRGWNGAPPRRGFGIPSGRYRSGKTPAGQSSFARSGCPSKRSTR